ncbi:MAG: hypothetical protein ACOCXJ_04045, partial [Planctomycetota bacterium]
MQTETTSWDTTWPRTRARHAAWWRQAGFVVASWNQPHWGEHDREPDLDPGWPADPRRRYEDVAWRTESAHWRMARASFPIDTLPCANTCIGPGSLALALGSEPGFSDQTVWFLPCWEGIDDPTTIPTVRFDPDAYWYQIHERTCRSMAERAQGRYLIGCPDLIENIDILASLRDTQTLMMDLLDEPEWVEEQVAAIDEAWIAAFEGLRPWLDDGAG